ncbi:MAG TPA: hypothetical protein PLG17_02755 [Thermodesulfobacteriota bacterium]|nr:hypothetical protein [Thermodesulfobacteriota bacterium]
MQNLGKRAGILLMCLAMIIELMACSGQSFSPPPTKKQVLEAISPFRTPSAALTLVFGEMQEEVCLGAKLSRFEIVELKKAADSDFESFPGNNKYVAVVVEEGNCSTRGGFYLERDFLLVRNGPKGLPTDKSGAWGAWPLEFVYDEDAVKSIGENYDALAEKTGMSGWFLIQMSTISMEKNSMGINITPRNEDHYFFEFDSQASE